LTTTIGAWIDVQDPATNECDLYSKNIES